MKKIILLLTLILFSSFVCADLTTNLISYHSFNDQNLSDSANSNDATNNGATYTSSGKLGGAYDFDGSNDYMTLANEGNFDFERTDAFSVSFWIKTTQSGSAYTLISKQNNDASYEGWSTEYNNADYPQFILSNKAWPEPTYITRVRSSSVTIANGSWFHVVMISDGTDGSANDMTLYINNVAVSMTTEADTLSTNSILNDQVVYFGSREGASQFFNGIIDEIGVWDIELSSDDVDDLYNSGNGFAHPFTVSVAPDINITTPTYNDHLNDDPVLITYLVEDVDDDLLNCTIQLNGVNQTTNNDINTTANPTQYYNLTTTEGNKNITIICFDGTFTDQDTTIFVVDRTNPDWTIRTINTDNSTIIDRSTIDYIYFNDSVDDTYLFAYNITTYYPNGSIWFTNETIDLNVSNFDYELNKSIVSTQPNGTYKISYTATDDHTAKEIEDYKYSITPELLRFEFEEYNISISSNDKSDLLSINTTKELDRYTFDFEYDKIKKTIGYRLTSQEKIYYRENLYEFPVFIIGEHWIDFNLDLEGITYEVYNYDTYNYHIIINLEEGIDKIKFKSIGGLNTQQENYTFKIKENQAPIIINTIPNQNISIYENTTVQFTTSATDIDNDTIIYKYYYDGILNYTGQNHSLYFGFLTSGNHNITVIATDGGIQDSFTWNITVINYNLAPLIQSLTRTPTNIWYSNIENTKFVCEGLDQDNETQPINWTVNIEYRDNILWNGLTSYYGIGNNWYANISISALQGKTLDVRCKINDGINETDWYQVNDIVTIQEAYTSMSKPSRINPTNTIRDYVISVTCTPGTYGTTRSYRLIYDMDYKYNGTWYNLSYDLKNKALFDMSKISYGENVTFRCRINDGINITNYLTGETVTRNHITNLFMFSKGDDEIKLSKRPYIKGLIADLYNEANVTIIGSYADCNGNGYWDYYKEYTNYTNVTKETFNCVNIKGVIPHTVGIIINKTGTNNKFCGIKNEGYCKVERTYDVVIK